MRFTIKPRDLEDYRQKTASTLPINHSQRMCAGPCRRNRSLGQYAVGATMCKQCVLRMP